jgi:hypothetical protein
VKIINELKEQATYLEAIANAPIDRQLKIRIEKAAQLMRKAARMIETQDDDYIPEFLRKNSR